METATLAVRVVEFSAPHEHRILAAVEEAAAVGRGAAQLDGKMIDAASARLAQNIVNTADSITARRAPSLTLVPAGS